MRSVAYGVLGRICLPCRRVTPESTRHASSRFSAHEVSFVVPSSALDSWSPEMPSCRVSGQSTSSARSSPCYSQRRDFSSGVLGRRCWRRLGFLVAPSWGAGFVWSWRLSRLRGREISLFCGSFLAVSGCFFARVLFSGARSGFL